MQNKLIWPLVIATLLLADTALAQQSATIDETGEKVVLKDDGTWSSKESTKAEKSGESGKTERTEPDEPTFEWRGLRWGMSEKKVKRILGKAKDVKPFEDADKEPNLIKYKTSIGSDQYVVAASFHEGKLNGIIMIRAVVERNDNRHFEALDDVVEAIGDKYGEMEGGLRWSNDLYRDDPSGWGTALVLDHVSAFYQVKTGSRTRVSVMLSGGRMPKLMILYQDLDNETPEGPSGF